MKNTNLRTYIDLAGGPSEVSRLLPVTRKTLWKWQKFGMPHTEWSGKTTHAVGLAELCKLKGFEIDPKKILEDSRV